MTQASDSLQLIESSTPTFEEFDPTVIRYQAQVIDDLWHNYDYSLGLHKILLSGAVGSAKSMIMAHVIVRHCIENNKARFLLGRRALPDLKETIFLKIKEHLEGTFEEGSDYWVNESRAKIRFCNGSEIISRTWHDKNYMKFRSLDISAACIEELVENDDTDKKAYDEICLRIGRLTHVKQPFLICATNPDSPAHWVYEEFELPEPTDPTKHVYYSETDDNPFLPDSYKEQLKRSLDPKMYLRMGKGQWIEITKKMIYHAYDPKTNKRKEDYTINELYPVRFSWDFNIADGKPLSVVVFQFVEDEMHIFDEVVVESMNTEESCSELSDKGLLDYPVKFYIHGDATGRRRDTRSKRSDYDIIEKFFANFRVKDDNGDEHAINYEVDVPLANPPVRSRHNRVNAYCKNELGDHRLFIYEKAKTADKALRLTQLKKGGNYIEDDSKPFQHIGTAIGYGLFRITERAGLGESRTTQL